MSLALGAVRPVVGAVVVAATGFSIGCTSSLRLPFNRPDMYAYDSLGVQTADSTGPVRVRFAGTSTILFEDGATRILSDGFFSRPRFARVAFTRIQPSPGRIAHGLRHLTLDTLRLDAVFVVHSHYDHALDAALVAEATHAELVGSESTRNAALGVSVRAPIRVVQERDTLRYGDFRLTFIEAAHSYPDRARGTIDSPLVPPRYAREWKTGTVFSVLLEHPAGNILVHASANFIPGALHGYSADVAYLGIIGLGEQPAEFVERYWDETVLATGSRRVILIHWDDPMRALDEPLVAVPYYAGSATDAIEQLTSLGRRDDVEVLLPVLWLPTNPFRAMSPARTESTP